MSLDGLWYVIQQLRLLSLKDPTVMDKARPLLPSFCWLSHLAVHGVVCESLELCCLG